MTLASRVCKRICTRPAAERRSRSDHRMGRSPMTATMRSTIVAGAVPAAPARAKAAAIPARSAFRMAGEGTRSAASALAVLEALAGAGLPVLLALLLAGVAREEARALDRATLLGVERDERTRDAVAHRLGLRGLAAARARGPDVELVLRFDELERLAEHHARGLALEVVVDRKPVDDDGALAGLEPD